MKKIVFFLFFMVVVVVVSAQSLDGSWQLQNPPNKNISCVLYFNTAKKSVVSSLVDMRDRSYVNQNAGKYTFSNGKLLIVMKFTTTYKIRWINKDKMILNQYVYARTGSKFDLYLKKYKKTKH